MSAPPPPPRRARPTPPQPGDPGSVAPPPRRRAPDPYPPDQYQADLHQADQHQADQHQADQYVVPASPTRAERQAQGGAAPRSGGSRDDAGGGRRWGLVAAAIIAVVVIGAGAFFLLSGSSDTDSGPTFKASTAVDLQPGETTVAAAGFNGTVPPEVPQQILSVLGTYVEDGIVAPLRKGKADDAALATVFDPAAVTALAGDERAIVLDEGLPKAVGKVTVTTPPVPLTVLVDKDGKTIAVSAGVQLAVTARAEKGNVQITRTGSFVFAPDEAGGWKITGWTLTTDRGGPGVTPTSTAASVTTTTVAP